MSDTTPNNPQPAPEQSKIDKFFDDLKSICNGDPAIKQKLIDTVNLDIKKAAKKPTNWGKFAYAPYYKEIYARELLPLLDAMLEDGIDKEILFSNYPQLKRRTLYTKINQAWLYVLEHMDTPDKKYLKQRAMCEARMTKSGVKFFIINPDASKPLEFVNVDKSSGYVDVQNKIAQILETEFPGMRDFEFRMIRGITINEDEIRLLEASVAGVVNLAFSADQTWVKLQKLPV